jgi:hypothetical protein
MVGRIKPDILASPDCDVAFNVVELWVTRIYPLWFWTTNIATLIAGYLQIIIVRVVSADVIGTT